MECLTQSRFKKPRRHDTLLKDVSNTLLPSPFSREQDEVALKLLSILQGDFESPGFSNTPHFRRAALRQKQMSQSKNRKIVFDLDWKESKNEVYTRGVPDWDWFSGDIFHIRWWSNGLRHYCCWDRDLTFWSYDELQEAHREQKLGTSGPRYADWCRSDEDIDWNMLWSAAIFWKYTGSSGIKTWDEQFRSMTKRTKQ